MPKGFNRLGRVQFSDMSFGVFQTYEEFAKEYTNLIEKPKFCMPVWRYRNEQGHTFLRIYNPRINYPAVVVILEDCLDKFSCVEITQEDINAMD
jgi:hypothetical protein